MVVQVGIEYFLTQGFDITGRAEEEYGRGFVPGATKRSGPFDDVSIVKVKQLDHHIG